MPTTNENQSKGFKVNLEERRQLLSELQAGAITFSEYRRLAFGEEDAVAAMGTLNQVFEERRLLRGG